MSTPAMKKVSVMETAKASLDRITNDTKA